MISYGSRALHAEMSKNSRSHQLGEGLPIDTGMSCEYRPSRLVYGRNTSRSQQCQTAIDTFHQLGKGQSINTGMSGVVHPSRSIYGSQILIAETLCGKRSHQLGKGQTGVAKMSNKTHPPRPVYGSLCYHAVMPIYDRSHLLTRGQLPFAELSYSQRLSREGSECERSNVTSLSPFPTSFGPPLELRKDRHPSPN